MEFVPDLSQLETAVEQLAKNGQIDQSLVQSLRASQSESKKLAQTISNGPVRSLEDLDKRTKLFVTDFIKGFQEGVEAELLAAKDELEAFRKKFDQTGKTSTEGSKSLKKELRELTAIIAQAKASGGPIDQDVVRRAGELKDAIADANAEINNFASDTRTVDNIVGSIGAVAGAFSAVQGAAALFGDESEDLQKTLLKVNASMAVATGLQQVLNAFQKEGALTLTLLNIQERVYNAQLALETAQQSKNVVVKGLATVAQRALNAAMAANPIGLLVVALATAAVAFVNYTRGAREAAAETERLNGAISRVTAGVDSEIEGIQNANEQVIIGLEKRGAKDSEITRQRISNLRLVIQAEQRAIADIDAALARGDGNQEQRNQLVQRRAELVRSINQQNLEGLRLQNDFEKNIAEEQKKRIEDERAARQKAYEDERRAAQDAIIRAERVKLTLTEGTAAYRIQERAIAELNIKLQDLDIKYQDITKNAEGARFEIDKLNKSISDAELPGSAITAQLADLREKVVTEFGFIRDRAPDVTRALAGVSGQASATIDNVVTKTRSASDAVLDFLNNNAQAIQAVFQNLNAIGNGFAAITQEQQENSRITIENKRKEIDALLEAGAITEKEAEQRQKRVDREEARLQQQAAKRQKDLAIFNATINTLQGITQALASLPPPFNFIQAGVVAAFGFAQVRAIASRPIPKFASGKKGTFEGLGIVGEAGAELVTGPDGSFIADGPTLMYLTRQTKVFTANETRAILPKSTVPQSSGSANGMAIDYAKLGAEVGKNIKPANINIDRDGIAVWTESKLARENYFNNRYSSK